jgi:uncharacterized protein (TIGR02246 family)
MKDNRLSKNYFARAAVACFFLGAVLLTAAPSRASDEAGVRQAGKDYLAAVDRGDAKAMADFWTPDGTYTDENGHSFKAQQLLSKVAGAGHLNHKQTTASNVTVHFVTDDVAIEEADSETAGAAGQPPIKGHYTATWVHKNGAWKLDNLRESRTAAAASDAEDLASLAPMAGQWSGQIGQANISITAKWDATKKFLHRDVSVSGVSQLGGTQEIGIDPKTGRIKSWAFFDDGSVGEGLWSLQGTVWMEVSTRVLPDGKIVKAIQVYKFQDKDTLVWKLIRGSVDGQPIKPMEAVLKRS